MNIQASAVNHAATVDFKNKLNLSDKTKHSWPWLIWVAQMQPKQETVIFSIYC